MKTEYVNVNGYLIPKLKSSAAAAETIGKYGMKCRDPLKWAAAMQEFRAQAEEIVCAELIYAEKDGTEAPKFSGK